MYLRKPRVPLKLADTDRQIQRLWRNVSKHCVSIASSIDTTPPEMIPQEMRDRWLRDLRKTRVALAILIDRLARGSAAIDAPKSTRRER